MSILGLNENIFKNFLTVNFQADLEMYSVDNQWWINDTSLQEIWNELT